jgi:hypothetical protein
MFSTSPGASSRSTVVVPVVNEKVSESVPWPPSKVDPTENAEVDVIVSFSLVDVADMFVLAVVLRTALAAVAALVAPLVAKFRSVATIELTPVS